MMRLTILVPDNDPEGGYLLKTFLKSFEDCLNENGSMFKSYVAFTGGVKTGQDVRIGVRSPKQSKPPTHQRPSLWGRIKMRFGF